MRGKNTYRAPEAVFKIKRVHVKSIDKPNRAMLFVLPVLQRIDGFIRTTEVAKLCSCDRDRAQRALLRLHDMKMVEHRWSEERLAKLGGGRESEWQLRPMPDVMVMLGEWDGD